MLSLEVLRYLAATSNGIVQEKSDDREAHSEEGRSFRSIVQAKRR